jgi:hypothetical protein
LQNIETAADRQKWRTLLKETVIIVCKEDERGISGPENTNDEIKTIFEDVIDNLCVSGQKMAILDWERHEIEDRTKLNPGN